MLRSLVSVSKMFFLENQRITEVISDLHGIRTDHQYHDFKHQENIIKSLSRKDFLDFNTMPDHIINKWH
jgi:hypothetical protein